MKEVLNKLKLTNIKGEYIIVLQGKMNKEFYTIIAGPCSISTKKELTNIFKTIYKDINYFRCGIWKHEQKLTAFKECDKGLIWLRELQQKYNYL